MSVQQLGLELLQTRSGKLRGDSLRHWTGQLANSEWDLRVERAHQPDYDLGDDESRMAGWVPLQEPPSEEVRDDRRQDPEQPTMPLKASYAVGSQSEEPVCSRKGEEDVHHSKRASGIV